MKNQIIVLFVFGLIISSCGTTTQYVSSSYEDPIYYNPGRNQQITIIDATNDELTILKKKTRESAASINDNNIQNVIYMDSEDSLIVANDESYEEILCKFDSPVYVINVNVVDGWFGNDYWNYPYWSFGYYNPWAFRGHGYGYYNGLYGGWNSPYYWNSPFYNPWYGGYNGYYGGFYGSYYGGYYGGYSGYYDPWFYQSWPGYYQYGNNNYNKRDNYYGRRVTDGDGIHRGGSGGSYVRREANVEQIRGNYSDKRTESATSGRSQSTYRRNPVSGSSGVVHNTDVVRNNSSTNTNPGSTYQRGNTTYQRGNTTYQRGNTTYRQSAGTGTRESTTRESSSRTSNTPVYRKSTQSTGNNRETVNRSYSNNNNNTYERNNTSSRQESYSPPVTRSSSSGNTTSSGNSGSSSSSSGERSSSGSGSVYRR